jgi:hypothetical protein
VGSVGGSAAAIPERAGKAGTESWMDFGAWRRIREPARRRDGGDPTDAREGLRSGKSEVRRADPSRKGEPQRYRDSAGEPAGGVRAGVQPDGCVWSHRSDAGLQCGDDRSDVDYFIWCGHRGGRNDQQLQLRLGLLRVANELGRRNGLLRRRAVLREPVLVGRLLSGISAGVSSALLPATATTVSAADRMATSAAGNETTVSSSGWKTTGWRTTTGNSEADAAAKPGTAESGWTVDSTRARQAHEVTCEACAGEAGRTVDSACARRADNFARQTRRATKTDDASSGAGTAKHANADARTPRISGEPAECAACAEAECVFGERRRKAGERPRESQPQRAPAAKSAKRACKGTQRACERVRTRKHEALARCAGSE